MASKNPIIRALELATVCDWVTPLVGLLTEGRDIHTSGDDYANVAAILDAAGIWHRDSYSVVGDVYLLRVKDRDQQRADRALRQAGYR